MQHVDISNFVNAREASCAAVKGKQNSPISFPVLIALFFFEMLSKQY